MISHLPLHLALYFLDICPIFQKTDFATKIARSPAASPEVTGAAGIAESGDHDRQPPPLDIHRRNWRTETTKAARHRQL
jgi:hypothetical protein